jgi:predicted NBD/HSP70 family sugar kinase
MMNEQNRSARSTVMEALVQRGEISRADLALSTGLSRSTVTEVIQLLLDGGMLQELPAAYAEQRRGRPAIRLSLRAAHGYFVGVGISEVHSTMQLADLCGRMLADCDLPAFSGPEEMTAQIRRGVKQLVRAAKIGQKSIRGLGLALPGIVDQRQGLCRFSSTLGWRDVAIVGMVRAAVGVPTFVSNDADAAAVGQKLYGSAREIKNFASILLGRTIGCAHVIDGRLYRGHDGSAGEIGHMTIDPRGAPCRCGKRGCLDTIAGGVAIREKAKAAGLAIGSMRDLERLASDGSRIAAGLLREAGEGLGLAVAGLVQINNPETVLFADLEGFGNGLFYTATRQTIENNILPRLLPSTQIVFQPVEYSFLARGAASVAAQAYLIEGNEG